jgi:hypothetical protein
MYVQRCWQELGRDCVALEVGGQGLAHASDEGYEAKCWPNGKAGMARPKGPTVRNFFGTPIHRALIAIDVQDAMNGVLAVLALVVGLFLLGNAKHPGISPDRLCVKGETQQTAKMQVSLDTPPSSPGPTFEAARWYALLDSLEDNGPKEGSTFWR